MKNVAVTRKGQVTIPAGIRRKLGLEEGKRVAIWHEKNRVVIKPLPSILDLAGCDAGKVTPEEMKKMLDKLREEDK